MKSKIYLLFTVCAFIVATNILARETTVEKKVESSSSIGTTSDTAIVKAAKKTESTWHAKNAGYIINHPATANKTARLQLEPVKTEPVPVISSWHQDVKDIPAGFEAGSTVKVKINGKTAYHMVSTTMETYGDTRWADMRTEHWISEDGNSWRRHKILFRPGTNPVTGMWELTGVSPRISQ